MSVYTKYKPSGIEWLGEIPEHWISTRVKNAMIFDIGGTPSRNNMEYFDGENLWVSISDLNGKEIINDTKEKITDEAIAESNCKLIPQGSLLFSFKLSVGHIAFAGKSLYTNEAIAAFRPSNRLNVRLLKYLLQIEFESNANTNIYGAYLFNKETLGTAKIVFSENSKEQTAIANYLDEKTSKLDQLISNKKKQIKKLKEIRQIEINTAVTKGLDTKVKYKPSGIEWLGDIPVHWEVKRIKDNVKLNVSSLGSDTDAELDIKYLDISNVNNTGLTGDIQELKFFEAPSRARRIVQNGDVVMSTVRPYLKAITYLDNIPANMIASTGFAVMTSKFNYNSKFLFYQTVSDWFNETINSKSVGASYPALNSEVLVAAKIMVPPLSEQLAISHYLDEKTNKIDQLVSNIENQIEHLQEVRKIEIYNAVTGKIKVA